MAVDLTNRTRLQVPVSLLAGRHDDNTSGEPATRSLETIEAPARGFSWFEDSGHSPPWEGPAPFRAGLLEILDRVLVGPRP